MKNIIIFSVIAALLLGAMGAGFYVLWGKVSAMEAKIAQLLPEEEKEGEAAVDEPRPIISLPTMVVNLADKGGRRYLRATLGLELAKMEDEPKLEARLPQVKDAALKIMATRSFQEINDIAGKEGLRDEIVASLNDIIKSKAVTNVYFTEFVVQ